MRVLIAVIAGPHQGQVFSFTGHDTFLVGRSKHAHFRLPEKDEFFSRIHFLIEVNPPRCRLMDMRSTNGTYVNGRRVLSADLADGDLIQGGQTVLRVSLEKTDPEGGAGQGPATLGTAFPLPEPPAAGQMGTILHQLRESPDTCCVCAAVAGKPLPDADQPTPGSWPLCPGCRIQIDSQPQLIPGYQIVRELGRGGMGIVYLAFRAADGVVVALKTIKPAMDAGPGAVERFLREADILRELKHPGIVAFRDLGEAGGRLFFAMDFMPGTDAAQLLEKQGPWPISRAVRVVCQLLEALGYAHGRGFVHRDVKPANLLVTEIDGQEQAHLVDFGLARVYQASKLSGLTLAGQVAGTAPFMAPEQILNFREARPPVDQYAAGATLYNLLTGKYVYDFPRSFEERMLMILQANAVPIQSRRPEIPADLAAVIHRALAREPDQRFAEVEAMRQALLACGTES